MDGNIKRTTLFVIGDSSDFDSFQKFDQEKRFILNAGFDYLALDYKTLFKRRRLKVSNEKVVVVNFFPFRYWDKHIECKRYKGMYGNLIFLKKFKIFCNDLSDRIKCLLPDKEIEFVNDPRATALYRDKMVVMNKLSKASVKVPAQIKTRSVKRILDLLSDGKKIYIKPRCGSMGKGITYLTHDRWQTNFKVKGGRIIKHYSDYGWEFDDVTGNRKFLQNILQGDFIVEEEIPSFHIGKKKIDFRVYACFGKMLYIYPRKNCIQAVTTNISQGGKGSSAILKEIPESMIRKITKQVNTTMKVLGLGFAGIDVILDKNLKNAYVIDVNMFPGFPKRRTHNLARGIISGLEKKY